MERNFLSLSAEIAAERVMELTVQKDDLLLRLDDYKVPKKNLERRVSEDEVIVKEMSASVKQLIKKV